VLLAALQEKKAAKAGPVVDDEGWTTVVRQKKRLKLEPKVGPSGTVEPTEKEKKKAKKERKNKVLHFYRSQEREQKREGAFALRFPCVSARSLFRRQFLLLVAWVRRVGRVAAKVRGGAEADRKDESAAQVQALLTTCVSKFGQQIA
jgi:hypothetical protein